MLLKKVGSVLEFAVVEGAVVRMILFWRCLLLVGENHSLGAPLQFLEFLVCTDSPPAVGDAAAYFGLFFTISGASDPILLKHALKL